MHVIVQPSLFLTFQLPIPFPKSCFFFSTWAYQTSVAMSFFWKKYTTGYDPSSCGCGNTAPNPDDAETAKGFPRDHPMSLPNTSLRFLKATCDRLGMQPPRGLIVPMTWQMSMAFSRALRWPIAAISSDVWFVWKSTYTYGDSKTFVVYRMSKWMSSRNSKLQFLQFLEWFSMTLQ